jgi:hypothetical protein
LRRRVAGEVQDQHLGLGIGVLDSPLNCIEKIHVGGHRHVVDIRARDHRPVDVDRVARIGHQHGVAGVERRERQVGDALLGADGDDRLRIGIQIDVVARLVPVADRASQPHDALRYRIAVGVGTLHALDQLFHDVPRRRLIRIAHAEVDDVFAPPARCELQFAGYVKHVGREAFDAGKLFHRGYVVVRCKKVTFYRSG